MYFTMHFTDGLRPDIKSIKLVMRPQNLDTTSAIAMLQEEAGVVSLTQSPRCGDWSTTAPKALMPPRVPLPLPVPPPLPDKAPATSTSTSTPSSPSNDAALKAIKAYILPCSGLVL
jgi:hypothetical protein